MKKFVPIFIIGMVVLYGLQAAAVPFELTDSDVLSWQQTPTPSVLCADELDQQQPEMDFFGPIGPCPIVSGAPNYIIAQTFTPTKPVLSRVELMIGKNVTTTYDYTVSIRDALDGPDLTLVRVPAEQITTENFSWVEFDFPDIAVLPGTTYYIVSSTENVTENWYAWGMKLGDAYLNGTVYYTINDEVNWTEEPGGDMTFRTYGLDATELELEIAGGVGVKYSVKNVGSLDATDVEVQFNITGGLLNLINMAGAYIITGPLNPDESFAGGVFFLGLGPITGSVSVRAANALEVTKQVDGFVLFFFVILN